MRPIFQSLWNNYPTTLAPCNNGWDNQCAIRLSIALQKSGLSLAGYGDPTCGHGNARGAESLANFLWINIGAAFKYTNPNQNVVTGRSGIIFFKDLAGFRGGNGDHIDLWNVSKTKTGAYFQSCREVWFWPL